LYPALEVYRNKAKEDKAKDKMNKMWAKTVELPTPTPPPPPPPPPPPKY